MDINYPQGTLQLASLLPHKLLQFLGRERDKRDGVLEYWKKLYEEKDRGFEDTKVVVGDVIVYRSLNFYYLQSWEHKLRVPMQPLSAPMSDLLFLPYLFHLECNHHPERLSDNLIIPSPLTGEG